MTKHHLLPLSLLVHSLCHGISCSHGLIRSCNAQDWVQGQLQLYWSVTLCNLLAVGSVLRMKQKMFNMISHQYLVKCFKASIRRYWVHNCVHIHAVFCAWVHVNNYIIQWPMDVYRQKNRHTALMYIDGFCHMLLEFDNSELNRTPCPMHGDAWGS